MDPSRLIPVINPVIACNQFVSSRLFLLVSFIATLFLCNADLAALAAEQKKTIAITEIVEHPSLSRAKAGILAELKNNGYELNKNLEVIEKNAQGSIANAMMIAKQFVGMRPDAIVAISTPSAQTTFKAARGSNIPIVFSSVTDPVAAGLATDITKAERYISGAMDYPLVKEGVDLIIAMVPSIKKIGFLYSSGEANSVLAVELMKKSINGKFEYVDAQIANSNQLTQSINTLVGTVDAIYIPSDNIVFSALPKLVQLSRKHKLPIFSAHGKIAGLKRSNERG
jgi:putative ABC transport system substrate-binding protein